MSKFLHPLRQLDSSQIITLGFLTVILFGAVILILPICSADFTFTPFVDSLFTATSAVCITGLTAVSTAYHWNILGKLIILMLIQIGGIGFMSMVTMLFIAVGKKITLKERIVIQESFNLSQRHGLVSFTIYIFKFSFVAELIGAFFLSLRFIPQYGFVRGIFYGIFHSVSAFCNAGFDILGDNSLIPFSGDIIVNITVMCLIVVGGLGFPVYSDFTTHLKFAKEHKLHINYVVKKLRLHSKIALITTAVLIVFGGLFFFIAEYFNPYTIGNFSFFHKILTSLFQSVTLRTAGFDSMGQGNMTYASKVISIVLMYIGGSPASTAGGVKTVTSAILFLAVWAVIRGRESINVFHKNIPFYTLQKALAVVMMMVTITIGASVIMTWTEAHTPIHMEYLDILFEVVSAQCTVGLTTGITHFLSNGGKIVLVLCMYMGRLGPISVAIALTKNKKHNKNNIHFPEDKLLVG